MILMGAPLIGHSELGTLGRPGERSVTVNRTQ